MSNTYIIYWTLKQQYILNAVPTACFPMYVFRCKRSGMDAILFSLHPWSLWSLYVGRRCLRFISALHPYVGCVRVFHYDLLDTWRMSVSIKFVSVQIRRFRVFFYHPTAGVLLFCAISHIAETVDLLLYLIVLPAQPIVFLSDSISSLSISCSQFFCSSISRSFCCRRFSAPILSWYIPVVFVPVHLLV